MQIAAQKEHEWLKKFLGEWESRGEAPAGPDYPAMTWTSRESARAIGELWIQSESTGTMPGDGSPTIMQLTLGYDSKRQRFVGTWIGSMMDYLWVYEGTLSADGRVLTLAATGPRMDQPGKMAKYHDIHTFVDNNHRVLTSQMLDDDGEWKQFMEAHYYRQ
ncbi:MAG TPA: DUF1579 domain-containing protein [Moraxellaceae bacterium]